MEKLVAREILHVVSCLRKNYRYSLTSPSVKEDPILMDLDVLKRSLPNVTPPQIIYPFISIVKSGDTTGAITIAALEAIEKFIKYNLFDSFPNLHLTFSQLTHSITHCKFEATDAVSDEIVLLKILKLLSDLVVNDTSRSNLDDKAVCEIVEAAFGMCFQSRVSGKS
ncbi:G-box binding factor [Nowakowskiella sp. JEL0407]|nr:G-box binding factor [Nowakowskiella sp. JEL0407]